MPVPGGFCKRAAAGKGAPAWAVRPVLCAILPAASRATPLRETNLGSALNPAAFMDSGGVNESNGLQTVSLLTGGAQFAFPFEGTTYDSIIVATSGFFWLGASNTAQCCILGSSTVAESQFEGSPARIAPGWADLLLNLGGAVYFNQISDAGGDRSVLTYLNIPTDPSDPSNPAEEVSFQVQLYATGKMVFSYMQFGSTSLGTNQAAVIGITGGGDFSPEHRRLHPTPDLHKFDQPLRLPVVAWQL